MIMSKYLTYNGEYFIFKCSFYDKDIPKEAKFRWNPDKKEWWTNDLEKAKTLSQYADLFANKEISKRDEIKQESLTKSRATDSMLDIPSPEGLEYYPFQKAGIEYAINHPNVLIADEMGLGKTIQVLGLINHQQIKDKILIICPASLKHVWLNEANKWLISDYNIQVINSKDKFDNEANIIIINYDILNKFPQLSTIKWNLLVADECHKIKNHKTKRAAFVQRLQANRKAFLTGTPIVNRPIELYSIIAQLGFNMGFWDYAYQYCDAQNNGYGWDMSGASNLEDLQKKLRQSLMIRRLKKDVLTELPDKVRQIIELPSNGLSEQIAKEKTVLRQFKDVKNYSDVSIAFEEIAKIRRETAIKKVPYIIDYIKEILKNTDKVVVFAHHKDVVNKIWIEFKDKAVKLTGDNTQSERQKAVNEFQNNNNIKIFIGSIQAAGVGLTLTAADTAIFVELDWVPGNITQAEDRIHRIGQTNSVLIQHIVVNESIDAKLAKTIIEKQKIIEQTLNKPIITKESIMKELIRGIKK